MAFSLCHIAILDSNSIRRQMKKHIFFDKCTVAMVTGTKKQKQTK